jgi:hypothetical protein
MPSDLSDQIGEIGGVIRTMLGLTRHSRIRDQLRGTIELYQLVEPYPDLAKAKADLASVIAQQTGRLVETSSATGRQWNWGAFIVCWVIAGGLGVGAYFLNPHWGTWWATLLMVIVGMVGVLFGIAGLAVLLQKEKQAA